MSLRTLSEDTPHEMSTQEVRNEERPTFAGWKQEKGDPLSDENIQAEIDNLSDEHRDKLVRVAAQRIATTGIPVVAGDERWIGACYDIMRSLIENDMSLDDVEG